ncbi:hypothetical protein [Burkholderia sp. MSMB1498]|uniref:hypothetical protein n=1 Tax=Burkholderia sp. MSMB1498 TaxID=1637842 RepID=UPI0018D24AC8|nr:hypothetical protein [Burkholderia sp. MSMB1498]
MQEWPSSARFVRCGGGFALGHIALPWWAHIPSRNGDSSEASCVTARSFEAGIATGAAFAAGQLCSCGAARGACHISLRRIRNTPARLRVPLDKFRTFHRVHPQRVASHFEIATARFRFSAMSRDAERMQTACFGTAI